MNNNLRRQVLQSFKILHKTRQKVFNGDDYALKMARLKINEEYQKKKGLTDKTEIEEAVEYSKAVEKELRTTVIQAVETEPGKYTARVTSETIRLNNVPFKDCSSNS